MRVRKRAVLTGGTNGMGLLVAQTLAARGYDLVLLARDEEKARAVRTGILQLSPAAEIGIVYADFSRLSTIATAANSIAELHRRIDVLVNNAGMHAFSQRTTEDGFAEMTSVNYLAPWLLSNKLAPALAQARQPRVVTVASEAARHGGVVEPAKDLADLRAFNRRESMQRYGKTKKMNIMFSLEFARRFEGDGISSNCLDPGFNATGLGRELPFSGVLLRLLTLLGVGRPSRGAGSIVRIADDPEFSVRTGAYFSNSAEPIALGASFNPRALEELWQTTESALDRFL